jgi:putative phosphoribosyl transferase
MRGYAMFIDREDAGRKLAERIFSHHTWPDPVILGVPRGGVAVGAQVARRLRAPLRLIIPRKLPIPENPEAGFGAVLGDGTVVLNEGLIRRTKLQKDEIDHIVQSVLAEVQRREREYDVGAPPIALRGKTAIITDDGLATGYTMIAALQCARKQGPARLIAAVPVSPVDSLDRVKPYADEVLCLLVKDTHYFAVADFYRDFHDMSDEEVRKYLREALKRERGKE